MRVRIVIGGCLVVATAALAVPAVAGTPSAGRVPAACVVVNGPNGLQVQAGYAPDGPGDCTVLP